MTVLEHASLPWLALTLVAYAMALRVYRFSGGNALLIPVTTAVGIVVTALVLSDTPYATYFDGVQLLHGGVGPATVALAVPLYSQLPRLRQVWLPVVVALLAGSITAVVSAFGIAWALGASPALGLSLLPKSATMPIAMAVAEQWGGTAPLAACAVVLTGVAGSMLAAPLCKHLRIEDIAARGFAVGLSAHAIGTARALQCNAAGGAYAALAMALNGIATVLLVPLVVWMLDAAGMLAR